MTNREYLNTLSDEEFSSVVLAKAKEFFEWNYDPKADICFITVRTMENFEQWLGEEHKEN